MADCNMQFRSPQLLMASGIGDLNTLQSHDIDVIADRPGVGQNLLVSTQSDLVQAEFDYCIGPDYNRAFVRGQCRYT